MTTRPAVAATLVIAVVRSLWPAERPLAVMVLGCLAIGSLNGAALSLGSAVYASGNLLADAGRALLAFVLCGTFWLLSAWVGINVLLHG